MKKMRTHGRQSAGSRPRKRLSWSLRLAADVLGVPTLKVIARTDADAADLITSDCDPYDSEFITGERTSEKVLSYPCWH